MAGDMAFNGDGVVARIEAPLRRQSSAIVVAHSDRISAPPAFSVSWHLKYLEGLRGLAAILVTLQHIYYHTLWGAKLTGWQQNLSTFLGWLFPGRASVAVFIVLSGYLLMRPVVRAGTAQIPGGTLAYIRRRARRILPPYYAALLLTILMIIVIHPLQGAVSPEWIDAGPAFGAHDSSLGFNDIAAHLLLVHNLSWKWASKIDPPMWTIATEWQIYFLFPLILLPVWRRLGNVGSIGIGLALGLGLFLLTGKGHAAAPWFLGLFAMGAAVASCQFGNESTPAPRGFGRLAAILLAIYAVITFECAFGFLRFLSVEGLFGLWPYNWFFDLLIGTAAACFLISASAQIKADRRGKIVRFLSSYWLVHIGLVSYSLYLIHDPILATMKLVLDALHLRPWPQFLAMLTIGSAIVGAATYVFHIIFERPFMRPARVQNAEN